MQFLRTEYTFFWGKAFGNFWNHPGVACKQHINLLTNISKVMVSDIEKKHGISQTYLFTFDWYFWGDLSHRFKMLPQGNVPVLPESNKLVFAYFLTQV